MLCLLKYTASVPLATHRESKFHCSKSSLSESPWRVLQSVVLPSVDHWLLAVELSIPVSCRSLMNTAFLLQQHSPAPNTKHLRKTTHSECHSWSINGTNAHCVPRCLHSLQPLVVCVCNWRKQAVCHYKRRQWRQCSGLIAVSPSGRSGSQLQKTKNPLLLWQKNLDTTLRLSSAFTLLFLLSGKWQMNDTSWVSALSFSFSPSSLFITSFAHLFMKAPGSQRSNSPPLHVVYISHAART